MGMWILFSLDSMQLSSHLLPNSRLMAVNSKANLRILVILSAAGIFSLYPLLFHAAG